LLRRRLPKQKYDIDNALSDKSRRWRGHIDVYWTGSRASGLRHETSLKLG
jgi:hypothetical protein